MPRLSLIVATGLALATLSGCGAGPELVSSAREAKSTPTSLELPTTSTPPPTTTRPPATPAAARPTRGSPPSTATATPTTVAPASAADLIAVTDAKLGKLVTDQDGMTVYFLTTDPTKPPTSNCLTDCAVLWPPVLLPDAGTVAVDGIDAKLLGKLTRPDRTVQLTLAGHPLYRFSGDTPGSTLGNGLIGTAFAITPTGTKPATRDRV